MLKQLRELIDNNTHGPVPVSRKFVEPENWIDVCIGIGKDHTACITLHKEDYEALKEITDGA